MKRIKILTRRYLLLILLLLSGVVQAITQPPACDLLLPLTNDLANSSFDNFITQNRPNGFLAWEVLTSGGATFRADIPSLTLALDYFKKYPNDYSLIKNGLTNALDKQKYFDEQIKWLVGKQNLGRAGSSTVLSDNMIVFGKTRPADVAAHHIVASGHSNAFAAQTRAILQREGIDINEAANGVFLPKNRGYPNAPETIHTLVHTNTYFQTVFNRINNAPSGKIREELQKIADELLLGTFPY